MEEGVGVLPKKRTSTEGILATESSWEDVSLSLGCSGPLVF